MEKLRPDDAVAVAVPESAGENPPPVVPGKSGGGDEYGGNVFAESAEPQQQHTRVLVPTESTVPPRVLWRKENRSYTDKIWGIVYALSFVAFLSCGFFLVANSKPRYEHDSQGNRVISSHFRSDVESCCEGATSRDSFGFDLCSKLEQEEASGARRLQAGDSKYDGDEGIFDAFMEAPEIIVGLLAFAAFTALVWVLLLRFFSRPIVILTEVIKVGVFIYMGVVQESTGTRVFCFFIAAGIIAYDVWTRKEIMFAASILEHSTKALKDNPTMLVGCIVVKLFYALNAFLFVLFYSSAFNVVEVESLETCFGGSCTTQCVFVYPNYTGGMTTFLSLAYLWSIILFAKMRLSIIATMVGSWHFHPEDKPGVVRSIINSFTTSIGTLAVSSLISTVAERINRMLQEPCWRSWIGPAACVTLPLQLFLCCFGQCLETLIRMLTKFAVVLHVFTGLPFLGSAKKVFKIMSRHFKGGFVTEVTSAGVLNLGAYVFSICIALLAWAWLDARFECSTLPGGKDAAYVIGWIILGLFNLWYPVLGIYVIILINRLLQTLQWPGDNGEPQYFQHLWVNPLAAIFVGCISMMFFSYIAAIFLDTVDVLFLCFAIDKDNNVDLSGDELQSLIKTLPNYVEADARTVDADEDFEDDATPMAVAQRV
mmetsp:Transcript_25641/g.47786  ORF Transcript_25641/g.47786 Transcript_25641/m.47786 type:complete len:653 (-) Transcript_25641:176-2134(-)